MNDTKAIEYDQLTGLYSRWHHFLELQQILDNKENRVFVTLDVDHFKQVNVELGTVVGDAVLRDVARALREVYSDASIARISGDEFSVILAPSKYSRYQMSRVTQKLFSTLNSIRPQGMDDRHLTFSIGSVFIDPEHYKSPDDIYLDASSLRQVAKKHKGTYLATRYGCIPDVQGVFLFLCEDRALYNSINNRLFRIHDENDWMEYQREGSRLKEDMCARNQSLLNDLLEYYADDDLPDFDYEQLFYLIVQYASSLDAFMVEMFVGKILLPYYESRPELTLSVRSRLGHLYLLLAHNLVSIARMGDSSQQPRILSLVDKCRQVCRDVPHSNIAFEPYFFSICELLAHFESISMKFCSVEECDRYYEELRELLMGPDPVVFPDPEVVSFFSSLENNARLFPLYRACYLRMNYVRLDAQHRAELERRLEYIRQHVVDGVYDMAGDNPEYRNMAKFLQHMLLNEHTMDEMLEHIIQALHVVHDIEYGTLSNANLVVVAYLFLAGSEAVAQCSLPFEEKRQIAIRAVNLMLSIFRRRESAAADHQLIFLTQTLTRAMLGSPALTAADKLYFLQQSMASVMLDTYCHSRAVAAYAQVILSNIIDHHPQLLAGEGRPYDSVEQVRVNRQALLQFMECACMLHDVGKMGIASITGNAYRKLTDLEFSLIRRHPEAGVEILRMEPAFARFHPFVRLHHRWWNSEGGYPSQTGQEAHSNLQVLVDVLSICDSLEAATSRIGRNYRHAKSFLQILDEFLSDSDLRYSSEVIQTIISSQDTYYRLRRMVEVSWQDVYQRIFQEVVAVPTLQAGPGTIPSLQVADVSPLLAGQAVAPLFRSSSHNVAMPEWLMQMPADRQSLYLYALMERNRISVRQSGMSIFVYDVESDMMDILGCNEQGEVVHHFNKHFSDQRIGVFFSDESYIKCVEAVRQVVADPSYPREGQLRFENTDKTRSIVATYTSVLNQDNQVVAITGHFENSSSTREKMLGTIQAQNRYLTMLDAIASVYSTVIYSDVKLDKFSLIKAEPAISDIIDRFTTTQRLFEFTCYSLVDQEYQEEFRRFCDPRTVDQRLKGQALISMEYHSRKTGWLRAHLIPVDTDSDGHIVHMLFMTESIEAEHNNRAELVKVAQLDSLTGVYNRAAGEAIIREQMKQGGTQVFGLLDCDNFKRVNDQLSHLVGDKLLRELGKVLRESFPHATIMRLGGDEFVVYIYGSESYRLINSFNGVKSCFDHFKENVTGIRLPELENIAPTVSGGVVFTDGSVPDLTFEDLYQHADETLHRSKHFRGGTIIISEFRYRDYFH